MSKRGRPNCQSNASDEEMMNLTFKLKNKVHVKVKKSDTIKIVKAMICEKEGIEEDEHELFFAENPLWDGLIIKDSRLKENSTVTVVNCKASQMNLYFKMPANEKTLQLKVCSWYTAANIRSLILQRERIPENSYSIYYAGKVLESYKSVGSLFIENEATLQMISLPKDKVSIIVDTPKGPIKGEVKYTYTALDVKKIVESIKNIPSEDYELFKGRKQLQNTKTLAYYDIKELDLLKLQPTPYQISVKYFTGKTLTFKVLEADTIGDVKRKIAEEEGVPFEYQRLIFDWKALEDGKNLASYGIVKESELHLILCLGGAPTPSFQLI